MRPNPAFTPGANQDILHAAEFYDSRKPGLGLEFLDELDNALSLIRESPLIFTLVDDPVRRALVRRFPYGVFYLPGSTEIPDVVIAVIDLHQDPQAIRKAYRR